MAKKKKQLPDLSKQDILTPWMYLSLVLMETHALVLGMIYQLKNVNYVGIQSYVRSRCHRI